MLLWSTAWFEYKLKNTTRESAVTAVLAVTCNKECCPRWNAARCGIRSGPQGRARTACGTALCSVSVLSHASALRTAMSQQSPATKVIAFQQSQPQGRPQRRVASHRPDFGLRRVVAHCQGCNDARAQDWPGRWRMSALKYAQSTS